MPQSGIMAGLMEPIRILAQNISPTCLLISSEQCKYYINTIPKRSTLLDLCR